MTQTRAGSTAAGAPTSARQRGGFARLMVFLRQVVAELKKVVWPSRTELVTYTSVVLVFVAIVMAYVSLLDLGFGRLVLWVLGGSS